MRLFLWLSLWIKKIIASYPIYTVIFEKMKITIFIFILNISLISYGQSCDTIQDKVINCTDKIGLKQGYWENWEYQWVQNEMISSNGGFCQTKPLNRVRTELKSKGRYLDGEKIGKWEYIKGGLCAYYVYRVEYYNKDGSTFIESLDYKLNYSKDSLKVKSIVILGQDTIDIYCIDRLCVSQFSDVKISDFELQEIDMEIDKIRWGIYLAEIRKIKLNQAIGEH